MDKFTRVVVCTVMAVSVMAGAVFADSHGGNQPEFTKDKFELPISLDDVKEVWTARGYSIPKVKPYAHGWSRGEHTYEMSVLITLVVGRVEFIISGQRFVVEPGDELLYPAHAVMSARNIYDGTSEMVESLKW